MKGKGRNREGTYRYLTFCLLTLLISPSLVISAFAGPFEDGVAAYEQGDHTTAHRLFKPLAQQGVPEAQFNLGLLYDNGQGVPQDYAEAVKWYRRAAEQDHAKAQFYLALMYSKGQGVPQDNDEAMTWYRKAAEQGYDEAQFNLGVMYFESRGVPQDYAEAVKWYRRAAEQDHAKAQFYLALMYSKGQGVPPDYVLAHMWFNLAASRASASEGKLREEAVKNRDIVASWMNPDEIAEAQRLAREWKPRKEVR
jgi:TPR repeat protein